MSGRTTSEIHQLNVKRENFGRFRSINVHLRTVVSYTFPSIIEIDRPFDWRSSFFFGK